MAGIILVLVVVAHNLEHGHTGLAHRKSIPHIVHHVCTLLVVGVEDDVAEGDAILGNIERASVGSNAGNSLIKEAAEVTRGVNLGVGKCKESEFLLLTTGNGGEGEIHTGRGSGELLPEAGLAILVDLHLVLCGGGVVDIPSVGRHFQAVIAIAVGRYNCETVAHGYTCHGVACGVLNVAIDLLKDGVRVVLVAVGLTEGDGAVGYVLHGVELVDKATLCIHVVPLHLQRLTLDVEDLHLAVAVLAVGDQQANGLRPLGGDGKVVGQKICDGIGVVGGCLQGRKVAVYLKGTRQLGVVERCEDNLADGGSTLGCRFEVENHGAGHVAHGSGGATRHNCTHRHRGKVEYLGAEALLRGNNHNGFLDGATLHMGENYAVGRSCTLGNIKVGRLGLAGLDGANLCGDAVNGHRCVRSPLGEVDVRAACGDCQQRRG